MFSNVPQQTCYSVQDDLLSTRPLYYSDGTCMQFGMYFVVCHALLTDPQQAPTTPSLALVFRNVAYALNRARG